MTRLRVSLGRVALSSPCKLQLRATKVGVRWESSSSTPASLKKTALYDFHVEQGAKMVPFAGFSMPVQYAGTSVSDSHYFTRNHASLFDVSHMVQHTFRGPHATSLLEKMTPCGVQQLRPFQSSLSTLLWPTGGIVDDTIITRTGEDEFHVVTNAACREKDLPFIEAQMAELGVGQDVWKVEDNSILLALQGPDSEEILSKVLTGAGDLNRLYFGNAVRGKIELLDGSTTKEMMISRGGYTGEDGFELSLILADGEGGATEAAVSLASTLLKVAGDKKLKLAGLGARDSLRLEAGMCLYGHDLDDTTTPVEGSLGWIIPPERRQSGGFNGADVILPQLKPKTKGGKGVDRRRVGFVIEGAPAREGAEVHSKEGEKLGIITSGCPSPTLRKNIAMGYIRDGFHKAGTEVDILVRGKKRSAVISKMPFVASKYWKGDGN